MDTGMAHSHASCFRITCYKTGSYALMHLIVAISVAYLLTRDWRAALAIGIIEPVVQTVAFYFHDRAWSKHQQTAAVPAMQSVELRNCE